MTPDENVFYLIIDKQRDSENVYWGQLTEGKRTGKTGTAERIDWISLKGSLIKSLVHAVQLQGNGAAY